MSNPSESIWMNGLIKLSTHSENIGRQLIKKSVTTTFLFFCFGPSIPNTHIIGTPLEFASTNIYRCLLYPASPWWNNYYEVNPRSTDFVNASCMQVLGKIMDAEGKQLEALVGLASQICSVLCEHVVAPVLESCQDYGALVEKLVGELNSHKKPTLDEFPNIRALLVGLTVSIMEFCPAFAPIFREHRMAEALTKVEQYMVFFGTTGVVSEEPTGALPTLVARAKLLISANATSV
jgi:hypothetical protein